MNGRARMHASTSPRVAAGTCRQLAAPRRTHLLHLLLAQLLLLLVAALLPLLTRLVTLVTLLLLLVLALRRALLLLLRGGPLLLPLGLRLKQLRLKVLRGKACMLQRCAWHCHHVEHQDHDAAATKQWAADLAETHAGRATL